MNLNLATLQETVLLPIKPMTTLGWVFLIGSVGSVTILTFWCFRRVLTAPAESELVKPPDALGG